MANSRAGTGKIQDETGASCSIKIVRLCSKNKRREACQKDTEAKLTNGQSWSNLSNQ